ncbi:hypothetical protein OAL43_03360 [bacterium]|nr:hypothetical protein [bacterium]
MSAITVEHGVHLAEVVLLVDGAPREVDLIEFIPATVVLPVVQR